MLVNRLESCRTTVYSIFSTTIFMMLVPLQRNNTLGL